jgi:hypothetical protein
MKLREVNQKNVPEIKMLLLERSTLLQKIKGLEDELVETQLQLEKFTNNKLTQMLMGQKCYSDKIGLGCDKTASLSLSLSLSLSDLLFVLHLFVGSVGLF